MMFLKRRHPVLQQVLHPRLLPLLVVLGQHLHLGVELGLEALVLHHPVVMEEAVEVAIKIQILLRAILIQLEVTIKIQIALGIILIQVAVTIKTQIPLGTILIQVVWPLILNLTQRKQSRMK